MTLAQLSKKREDLLEQVGYAEISLNDASEGEHDRDMLDGIEHDRGCLAVCKDLLHKLQAPLSEETMCQNQYELVLDELGSWIEVCGNRVKDED